MATIPDLPPEHLQQERIVCSIIAAKKYHIPSNILLAIAEKENGKPGLWVKNANGTHDVGAMQFNTAYLKTLSRYGVSAEAVANAGCYAYDLAAWRIHGHLSHDSGDLWTRAANYHSRTPHYNQHYRADLIIKANRWANWLDKFIPTQSATLPSYTVKFEAKQADKSNAVGQASKSAYVPRSILVSSQ
jgi:hypothetical protein